MHSRWGKLVCGCTVADSSALDESVSTYRRSVTVYYFHLSRQSEKALTATGS